jgi:hypothetical protein
MYEPLRQYDALLADIKRQISRIKIEISPWEAMEIGNEIQSHLNRVMADVAESANNSDDYEEVWAGTVYAKHGNS